MNAAAKPMKGESAAVFSAQTLERVFSECFAINENTILQGGFSEPLYQPAAGAGHRNTLRYREDFFASALHEVAHWCIAGRTRRAQVDFGYWYTADGRNISQQKAFEDVEYKPQALEWFFAKACDYRFRISVDNLNAEGSSADSAGDFEQRVVNQAQRWVQQGLPVDGAIFFKALCREFGMDCELAKLRFSSSELC